MLGFLLKPTKTYNHKMMQLQFIFPTRNTDTAMALRVLGLGVFNVPARLARLIMCPFPVQGARTVYVFDKVNRRITVLDPVSTDKGADHYEAKHRGNILHLHRTRPRTWFRMGHHAGSVGHRLQHPNAPPLHRVSHFYHMLE